MNGQIHDAGTITASEAKGNFAVLGQWHDGDMLPRYAVHDAEAMLIPLRRAFASQDASLILPPRNTRVPPAP